MKLKKGDQIAIRSGKDRGKTAKILYIDRKEGTILAEGINMRKKHVRSKRQGKKGEIIEMPARFPASRAMLICPACAKITRIGAKIQDGSNIRICKKCGEAV